MRPQQTGLFQQPATASWRFPYQGTLPCSARCQEAVPRRRGGPPPGGERCRGYPNVVTDAGHERVQGDLLGAGGLGRLHRPAELVDEGGAPEDPFIPLVGLPAPAEGGAHGPAALGPQEPPALELGPAALGAARGHKGAVGGAGPAGGAELGEDRLGVLPGPGDGPQKAPRTAG